MVSNPFVFPDSIQNDQNLSLSGTLNLFIRPLLRSLIPISLNTEPIRACVIFLNARWVWM